MHLANFVQYIMAHDIILTKYLTLNFEKLACHNFCNEHSGINVVCVSESLCK